MLCTVFSICSMRSIRRCSSLLLLLLCCLLSSPQRCLCAENCPITPNMWADFILPQSVQSNNLRRLTGSSVFASGELVILQGRVLDSACVPITGAKVEIWQADSDGRYKWNSADEMRDMNFAGSGRTVTDNLGRYSFMTVIPGYAKDEMDPNVIIHVSHSDFIDIETRAFFSEYRDTSPVLHDPKEEDIPEGLSLKCFQRHGGYKKCDFEIVLDGKDAYRSY